MTFSLTEGYTFPDPHTLTYLVFEFPMRVISEANNYDNWRVKKNRKNAQKSETIIEMRKARKGQKIKLPCEVKLTRIGPKRFDSDNLSRAFKAVRDSIAGELGVDDGDESQVAWSYDQEVIGKRQYGVRVEIKSRGEV